MISEYANLIFTALLAITNSSRLRRHLFLCVSFQKLENYTPVCCADCSTFTIFTALMLLTTKSAHILSANLTHKSEADGGKQNFKWHWFKVLNVQLYFMCARNSLNMCF